MPQTSLCPDEPDRADMYALLSALLLQPQTGWVEQLASLPPETGDDPLGQAWAALVHAARRGPDAVRDEHDALFVAAGTPRLNPYQCYYRAGWLMDKPLAALRDDLQQLGLARLPAATELEDHLGALCEAMHVLVASGHPPDVQRAFFSAHLAGWSARCLRDIAAASDGGFYAAVAAFAQAFLDAEARLFELDDVHAPAHPPRTSAHAAATS
jgi:TorA maturation chaperone TorD